MAGVSFLVTISSNCLKRLDDKGNIIEERLFFDIFQIQPYLLLHDNLDIILLGIQSYKKNSIKVAKNSKKTRNDKLFVENIS